jgi:cell division protein FtsA
MAMDDILVAIDVGTTKICTLIAEVDDEGRPHVVGMGQAPSQGLRKGMVVNIEEATGAIAAAVERAEQVSGYTVERACVGVTGEHIRSLSSTGLAVIPHGGRTITREDVRRAVDAAQTVALPQGHRMIHVLPCAFKVDEQEGIRDPVGMQGYRLETHVNIITGATASLYNLIRCVEQAGVEVQDLVLEPLASAEAVLSPPERELGVALVDIGGGTTDIAVFRQGTAWHTAVLPVGGNQFTSDIAYLLRTPFASAEEIKIRYGHAVPEEVDSRETVNVTMFGDDAPQQIPRQYLARILEARGVELFQLIQQKIEEAVPIGLLPAGLVLCGGTARLSGLREVGRRVLEAPTRVGRPDGLMGLVEQVDGPEYATSTGLLLWELRHGEELTGGRKPSQSADTLLERFFGWVRSAFFPR